METSEQVRRFEEFFEDNYKAVILESSRCGDDFLCVDFGKLAKFDPDLADLLLEEPDEVIAASELAIRQFDVKKKFNIRFRNFPKSQVMMIRNIRSRNLDKFYCIEGIVRQKSDVRPQVTSAKFECPSCGNVINVLQLEQKFKEPSRCGCGRKGKFRLLSKDLIDAQGITLEEAPEDLEGGEQPKRLKIFLKDDLVSPISDKHTNPGSKILVNGVVKESPLTARDGSKLTRFDILLEANYIESVKEDYSDISISKEDEKAIMDLAHDPKVYERVVDSVAPSVYGHDKIKEALVLQLVGGVKKERTDGVITRGDMHILLIGDPGAGKCVSGDTKVMLDSGEIVRIDEFVDDNKGSVVFDGCFGMCSPVRLFSIGMKGENFASSPVKLWVRKSPERLLKITTFSGNELVVTDDHPLFTTKEGLIIAKEARCFSVSDFIACPSRLFVAGSVQEIPDKILLSKSKNKVKYSLPRYFDSDFARLFGYLVGDGYVKERPTTSIISFTNIDLVLLGDFEFLIKKIFGLSVSKRKKKDGRSWEYYISSIELVRVLKNIDPNIAKMSEDMCISRLVSKSPDFVVKAFLRSLFDCEAYVNKKKCEIEFSSKSKGLVGDLKFILLRFGILSQISSSIKYVANTEAKIRRRYYRLRVSGEDCKIFEKEIGFMSDKKKDLAAVLKDRKFNTNKRVVPDMSGLLVALRKKYNLAQSSYGIPRSTYQHYERGDRFPSVNNLKKLADFYNKIDGSDPLVQILMQISSSDIFWDRVKTVGFVEGCGFVYDLEIEKVHNYMANCVMVHNSQLLKRFSRVAPKSRYVSGKGVSGAGLTASVVKDEFLGGWALEAGALPLCNRGFCCIDEMDKMSPEDTAAMHEALEGQTITIAKANIQATLRAETTVLAAANPKFGRFDPYDVLAKQINMPPTLINRFDLIFPVKDLPDEKNDERLARHILSLHKDPDAVKSDIDSGFLRKFIAYARQRCKPQLTDAALNEIKKYYVDMRNQGSDEAGLKSVPISARQLEGLVRLSEASAKIRLDDKVTKKDARRAIELVHYCLSQIGLDPKTGKIDIDRIATGVTTSQRSKIFGVKEIIGELENKIGKIIPVEDVVKECASKGIDQGEVEDVLEKLKRSGDIFEPKHGFIGRMP